MKLAAFGLAAIAAVALSAGSASAQYVVRGGHQHHNHGVVVSPGFGGYSGYRGFSQPSFGYGYGSSLYNPGFGGGFGGGGFYNPYPRGHFDYVPGHFDYHRGHYHYHPGHYHYHVPGTRGPRH
jgi:hypothetical protein